MYLELGESVFYAIRSAVIVLGFLYLMKLAMDKVVSSHYVSDDEIKVGNTAVSLRRAGLYIGTAIALFSTINGLETQLIDGATIIVFMILANMVSEHIVFPKFDNLLAIKNKNMSMGFAEAGLFIATGIIASGSFAEDGPWLSSILFFTLGQIFLILAILINEKLHKGTINEIKKGNISAGIMIGGLAIAYALVLKGAIAGPFNGWFIDIQAFLVSALFGGFLIIIFANKIIERLFFKGKSIHKELIENNYSVITVVVTIKIAIAITISGVLI